MVILTLKNTTTQCGIVNLVAACIVVNVPFQQSGRSGTLSPPLPVAKGEKIQKTEPRPESGRTIIL